VAQAAPLSELPAGMRLVECPGCGLHLTVGEVPQGAVARCSRCGAFLRAALPRSFDAPLALALSGAVLLLIANFMPFMSLELEGRIDDASLTTGALGLLTGEMWPVAVLILALTVAAPAVKLGSILYVLIGLKMRPAPPGLRSVLRWLDQLHPWSMIEVYLLGLFVAYVKLADLATVRVGVAVYALAALMMVMATIDFVLDYDAVWRVLEARGLVPRTPPPHGDRLARCEVCGLLSQWHGEGTHCPRCDAHLHRRKPNSQARCWALVITAAILYAPANLYPILTVISFGRGAPDTILSGVKHLLEAGMWPLALLVFFASITVPVLKISGLVYLLIATRNGSRWRLRDRTVLYRIIDVIGRWSMIDIFMLSVLVALVRLGAVASVSPGIGALAFAGVVVITMFAAMSFDPRVMWDAAGENR
jgi:paraquat-inducible protein A